MSHSIKKTARHTLLALAIVLPTAGVLAWLVYPNEVAARWNQASAPAEKPYTPAERQAILTDWLGGENALAELRGAVTVRAYRWDKRRDRPNYTVQVPVEEPVELTSDQRDRFINFVTDHTVHVFSKPSRHSPVPSDNATMRGVTIQVETTSRVREFTMWYPDLGKRMFVDEDGGWYFQPDRLLPLLRELFPSENDWVLP